MVDGGLIDGRWGQVSDELHNLSWQRQVSDELRNLRILRIFGDT